MARVIQNWKIDAIIDDLDELEAYLHDVKYLIEAIDYERVYGKLNGSTALNRDMLARDHAFESLGWIRHYLKLKRK